MLTFDNTAFEDKTKCKLYIFSTITATNNYYDKVCLCYRKDRRRNLPCLDVRATDNGWTSTDSLSYNYRPVDGGDVDTSSPGYNGEWELNLQERVSSVIFSLSLLCQHGLAMRSLLILDRETDAYKVHANKLRTITCYKNITQQIVVSGEGKSWK